MQSVTDTHGPYLSALEIGSLYIKRYINLLSLLLLYIFRISMSDLYIRVVSLRSRSQEQKSVKSYLAIHCLKLQWRQVRFSHSGYDATCLQPEQCCAAGRWCVRSWNCWSAVASCIADFTFLQTERCIMTELVCVSCSWVVWLWLNGSLVSSVIVLQLVIVWSGCHCLGTESVTALICSDRNWTEPDTGYSHLSACSSVIYRGWNAAHTFTIRRHYI